MCERQIGKSSRLEVSDIPALYSLDTSVDGGCDVAPAELLSTARGRGRNVSISSLLCGWSCKSDGGQNKDGGGEVCEGNHGDGDGIWSKIS